MNGPPGLDGDDPARCRSRKPGAILPVRVVWQVLRLRVLHRAARRFAQDDSSVVIPTLPEEGLLKVSTFPRRLKPRCHGGDGGGTEIPPFQSESGLSKQVRPFKASPGFQSGNLCSSFKAVTRAGGY